MKVAEASEKGVPPRNGPLESASGWPPVLKRDDEDRSEGVEIDERGVLSLEPGEFEKLRKMNKERGKVIPLRKRGEEA